jgi:ABC-type Zn uptake system ZnuABC Zn-binding protein ZnuA
MATWQAATVALVAAEGVGGLWLSVETNAPPGAAIAMVGGAVFALVAAARTLGGRRALAAAAAIGALLAASGCGGGDGGVANGGGPKIVATTTVLADIAREAAGPNAEVVGLLRPNTDPHEYEPRPQDIADTAGADVVLLSGGGLDGWMREVLDSAGGDPEVLDVGAAIRAAAAREGRPFVDDPHWWHDPRHVVAAARSIAAAVAGDARGPASAYVARVRALDRGIARCFAAVPRAARKLVTDHDAFGHFARRYSITVTGAVIPSQTTQAQASAGDLASLSKTIRRAGVRTVFPESSVSAKVARALARQTGAAIGRELYGDTLGPADSRGATYLRMEESNADAMVRGFTDGRRGCRIAGAG